MAKVVKYIPVWRVTFNGVTYEPAKAGETPRTIEGLHYKEIERLLAMNAITKLTFDDGVSGAPKTDGKATSIKPGGDDITPEGDDVTPDGDRPLDEMTFSELKEYAKALGISTPFGTSKEALIERIEEAETDTEESQWLILEKRGLQLNTTARI